MSDQKNNHEVFPCCPIWWSELKSQRHIQGGLDPIYELDSPRAGGKYTVLSSFSQLRETNKYKELFNDKEKIVLSAWIARENLKGNVPDLTSMIGDNRRDAEDYFLNRLPSKPNPTERAYLLLEGLVKKSTFIGKTFLSHDMPYLEGPEILCSDDGEKYAFFYALSYCDDNKEMNYLLDYLRKEEFIHNIGKSKDFQVTVKGFEQINTVSNTNSKTAFIAMWIHSSMDKLYRSIETAVKQAGYKSLRIDKKEHIQKIDDEVLAEIKKARFVICDLTSEEGKPRGSVYFEAGYALGKDISIIWTCKESLKEELAFDIRQYNCLFWEENKMDDFVKKLQQRIENAIGKGPLKQK